MGTDQLEIKSLSISTLTSKINLRSGDFRFILVLEGHIHLSTNGQSIKVGANDFLCVSPNLDCNLSPFENTYIKPRMIMAAYESSFIQKYIPAWNQLQPIILQHNEDHSMKLAHQMVQLATVYYSNEQNKELSLMRISFELLSILAAHYCTLSTENIPVENTRAQKIMNYIQSHYDHPVTLVELAGRLHISSAYLSRYIKKHMNMGFREYLQQIRMEHAIEDLISTNDSITAVALNNGFPNVASLNKQFRECFEMTPNQYRQANIKSPADLDKGLVHEPAPTGFEDLSAAFPQLALSDEAFSPKMAVHSVQIPQKPVQTLNEGWHDMINLGFGCHCGQIKFQKQLKAVLDKIHFKYGRIQGIFRDYNDYYAKEPNLYPLPGFDHIFDYLGEVHMIPHIDFSVMCHLPEYRDRRPDMNLIRRFLRYYLKRYGIYLISQWRFEYSMPKDDHHHPLLSASSYIRNFKELYEMVHTLVPGALLGGFGCSPLFTWALNEEILAAFQDANVMPDYLSLHLYPYEPSSKVEPAYPMISVNPHFYKDYIVKLRHRLKSYHLGELPLYVTHLQNEIGPGAFANDSAFVAAYLFKTYFDIYAYVSSIAYAAFSDIVFDNLDENPYFFGGSGMITQHGLRKPAYFALFMLAKTSPGIMYHSADCFITSIDMISCQILLHNYTHYTGSYCLSSYKKYSLQDTYQSFEDGLDKKFVLDLSNWPEGSYRLQKFCLGRENGSALDEYIRLGIQDDMLPIEMDYLQGKSNLNIEISYLDIKDGSTLTTTLKPMEIVIFVLFPVS